MNKTVRDPYADLYDHPRLQSKYHHPMPMAKRAAQFLPFDALTGYKELIAEEARATEQRRILSEEEREMLDQKIAILSQLKDVHPMVRLLVFVSDAVKDGGMYEEVSGCLRRIDETEHIIQFMNKKMYRIEDIDGIESSVFAHEEDELIDDDDLTENTEDALTQQ